MFNTENKGDIEVTADSGFDPGLDTVRTKPELEEDSSQLLVVSCLKTEAGGGDVGGVIRPPEVGDGGAPGSGVGLADGNRPDLVEIERILNEMSEAERMVEEEIESLPPEAVEEIELLKELLAASREEGKSCGSIRRGCRENILDLGFGTRSCTRLEGGVDRTRWPLIRRCAAPSVQAGPSSGLRPPSPEGEGVSLQSTALHSKPRGTVKRAPHPPLRGTFG